ncbi:MAG: hypothetical protein DBX58_08830 [Clostridiales bacterium]|nr:MAG: hypothetical protein DBX58_08830 [Clostridiales bacterium]HJA30548.1 hypothetical protein [Candidatus Eisenbergiella pullicola]
MKRNILAICDPEQEYAYRLMDALSRREDFPFEMLTFTGTDRLRESLAQRPVQILLIAQRAFDAEMKGWGISRIILLKEEEELEEKELPFLSKYSSVTRIAKKIMETAAEAGDLPPPQPCEHPVHFLGVYTPVHRCLQTTFSLVLGQILARTHRVLYLNFESYSGLDRLLCRSFEADFSDLLFHLPEPKEEVLGYLYRQAEQVNGLELVPPAFLGPDLFQIRREEWLRLLDILKGSRYEYVILDLSDAVMGLFELLRNCSRVYTIVREDGFARAKLAQYEAALERADCGDVAEKTRRCALPVFQRLPRDLGHPEGSELAQYVEKMLLEEERSER